MIWILINGGMNYKIAVNKFNISNSAIITLNYNKVGAKTKSCLKKNMTYIQMHDSTSNVSKNTHFLSKSNF